MNWFALFISIIMATAIYVTIIRCLGVTVRIGMSDEPLYNLKNFKHLIEHCITVKDTQTKIESLFLLIALPSIFVLLVRLFYLIIIATAH